MRFAITERDQELLRTISAGNAASPAATRRLRATVGVERAAWLLGVAGLQDRAREKFGDGCWWVTGRGCQQATAWPVADLKASWFARRPVLDLCCGVGGDLMRLARRGDAWGVDGDAEVAAMAAINLRQSGPAGDAGVMHGDVAEPPSSWSAVGGWPRRGSGSSFVDRIGHWESIVDDRRTAGQPPAVHIDPDRREASGRRTTDADRFSPAWPDVWRILELSGDGIVKLAPATKVEWLAANEGHRVWIAWGNTVREQALLWGATIDRAAVRPGGCSAVILRSGESPRWFHGPAACESPPEADSQNGQRLGTWLVDPHAAIRAAGLTEAFGASHGLTPIDGPAGFLAFPTPDLPPGVAALAAVGRIEWVGQNDDRVLRRELRRRNARPMTVKVRGVRVDPAMLVRRYRRCGERPVVLWIGRKRDQTYAAITRPGGADAPPPSPEPHSPTGRQFPSTGPPPPG